MAVRKTVLLARDCGDGAAHGSDKLLIIGGFGTYVMHRAALGGVMRRVWHHSLNGDCHQEQGLVQ